MVQQLTIAVQLAQDALDDIPRELADYDHVRLTHVSSHSRSFDRVAHTGQSSGSHEEAPAPLLVRERYRDFDCRSIAKREIVVDRIAPNHGAVENT